MKIALVYPYFIDPRRDPGEIAVPPIGIYYVGALLRANGYAVEIFNGSEQSGRPKDLARELAAWRPGVVGFSVLHANRWGALEIAAEVRRTLPEATVVFGGIGASMLWRHLLTHFHQVDAVVVGEGEQTFLTLVQCLEQEGRLPSELPGLALRRGGQPVFNGPAPPMRRLDDLPDPARYFRFQHLVMTRGCPGRCTFCGSPGFWGRRVRFHSAGYIADQIQRLHDQGQRYFFFSDDTFTLSRRRVIALCREILERGLAITWQAISKVNTVDAETLAWMRRAGCIQISYGVESGSAEIRSLLCKDIDRDQVRRAFALTVEAGILARAYFIYGSPGENAATIQDTLDLMEEIQPLGAIFYILDIFPGTALYEDFKERTGVTDDIWLEHREDIPYFETDPALDADQVLAFGRALRQGYCHRLPAYARGVRLSDDPALRPLHADFLSRLALTFHQGDYARNEDIETPEAVAETLYRRALRLAPDARAYLGLGQLLQHRRDTAASIEVLEAGLKHFPRDGAIGLCLAISWMNTGDYRRALDRLAPLENDPRSRHFAGICRQALGET
jgi:anaerobic magnesium-protoporphyrin IX monomethyl ester cyclase